MFAWRPLGFDFDPFGESTRMQLELQNEFDRLFNLGAASRGRPLEVTGPPSLETATEEGMVWTPRTDVRENDKMILVYTELPGLKPEDITITLQEGNICISGERKPDMEGHLDLESITCQTMEIPFGKFQRDIRVPLGSDASKIQATFENGILTVRIVKPERFKEIPVMAPEKVKGKEKLLGEVEEPTRAGQPERPREEMTAGRSPQDVTGPTKTGGTDQGTGQRTGERLTEQKTEQETFKETTHEVQPGKQAPQEPSPIERRDTQQTTGANV